MIAERLTPTAPVADLLPITCDGCGHSFDYAEIHLCTDHAARCAACADQVRVRLLRECRAWHLRNSHSTKGWFGCAVQDADRKRLEWLDEQLLTWWADHADTDADWLMNEFKADVSARVEYWGEGGRHAAT